MIIIFLKLHSRVEFPSMYSSVACGRSEQKKINLDDVCRENPRAEFSPQTGPSDTSEIVLEKKLKFGRDTIKRMQRNIFELCLITKNIISKYLLG